MKNCVLFTCMLMVAASGCIFFGGDIEESKIIEPYYTTYSGLYHQLIIKEKGASTNKIVISSNIDSIGHYDKFIFGKTGTQYFIINTQTQRFEGKYEEYLLFRTAQEKLKIYSEMESTD